jgi:hypothetical protein
MICANKDCKKEFTPKTHNQKYCKEECCRVSTNARIMEKYYEKKAIRNGTLVKRCKSCNCSLSRFNSSNLCSNCVRRTNINNKNKLLGRINDVS